MTPSADVIVANRALLDHSVPPGEAEPPGGGRGGLVVAVTPAIAAGPRGTTWVGAGRGAFDRAFVDSRGDEEIDLPGGSVRHRRVFFDEATWGTFYQEVANSFLWPLLHLVRLPLPERTGYFPRPRVPSPAAWEKYREANRAYARAALDAGRGDSIWVHDYQLGLVPNELRRLGYRGKIGFFLHTPFPEVELVRLEGGADLFREWLKGIAASDLAGLQSPGDADRYARACQAFGGTVHDGRAELGGFTGRFGAYPVGFDTDATATLARTAPACERLALLQRDAPVVVGLERDDYTKGIPERLQAMTALWRAGVRFHYLGLASPTREGVPGYERFQHAMKAATRMAGEAAEAAGCTCVQERHALTSEEIAALLRDADVVCTSSIADGMNLVVLQAAIAQGARPQSERGVITAGRDAGAATVYAGYDGDGLIVVDPFDTKAFARSLREALQGKPGRVSDRLVAAVRAGDARHWARHFLADLTGNPPC